MIALLKKNMIFAAVIMVLMLYSSVIHAEEQAEAQTGNGLSTYEDHSTRPAEYKIDTGDSEESIYTDAYEAYLNVVLKCIEQYGNTSLEEGPYYGGQMFKGLSFLSLVDFDQNGTEELMLVFYVEGTGYVFNIWGFDGQKAVLLQDGYGLYGTNGGMATLYLVTNSFGTFFVRGSMDSFEYNYYYGYAGKDFGLVKFLACEDSYESYVPGGCVIDGVPVSGEEWMEALALWGDPVYPTGVQESYSLTPHDTGESNRTWEKINETIQSLQQGISTNAPMAVG